MCFNEKEKSPGLKRNQVPTAQTRFSRGYSAKTLVAGREMAVTIAITAGGTRLLLGTE